MSAPSVASPSKRPHREPSPTDRRDQVHCSRIVIVDDEPTVVGMLKLHLSRDGFSQVVGLTDSIAALEEINRLTPDVVLLDMMMPGVSGLEILQVMRAEATLKRIPVIVLTASSDSATKMAALQHGASEFLTKPIDPSELMLRIKNTLSVKSFQDHLADYSAILEEQVRVRTAKLEAAYDGIIRCLACAAECRDDATGHHVVRVGRYCAIIAEEIGLPPDFVRVIEVAAQLHDLGKIGIPDSILLKEGPLDATEMAEMQEHCDIGVRILQARSRDGLFVAADDTEIGARIVPESAVLNLAASIAATHHERWDGSGYPHGLKGEQIPIEGRITAVADVFDALSSRRSYKPAMKVEECYTILSQGRGSQFDPAVLDAFFRRGEDVAAVRSELR